MTNERKKRITRSLGKIGWFYVGTLASVASIVTLVRLSYGQMQWNWEDFQGHAAVILGVSVGILFGPFAVFDLAKRATDLLNRAPKPGPAVYFWAGAVYPLLLLLVFVSPFPVLQSHGAMFGLMVLTFTLTFLLPWIFVRSMARRVERMNRRG